MPLRKELDWTDLLGAVNLPHAYALCLLKGMRQAPLDSTKMPGTESGNVGSWPQAHRSNLHQVHLVKPSNNMSEAECTHKR